MDLWLFFMGMSHITFHLVFALVLWLALQQRHGSVMLSCTWELMVQKVSLSLLFSLSLWCCLTRENQCRLCATCVKFMQSGVDAAGDKWPAADSINNFINALKTLKRPKKQFHNHFQKLKRLKTSRHPKETHANICAPPMVLLYQREYLWRPCRKHK